jgi:hypothetical protein
MEVIELPGYTEDEKWEIAHRYLVERQLKARPGASQLRGRAFRPFCCLANRIDHVPESSRRLSKIIWVNRVDEAIAAALIEPTQAEGADVFLGHCGIKWVEGLRKKASNKRRG